MATARSRSGSLDACRSEAMYWRAVASYAAHASYIAAETWKRLRAWTVGRGVSCRMASRRSAFHCRATDGPVGSVVVVAGRLVVLVEVVVAPVAGSVVVDDGGGVTAGIVVVVVAGSRSHPQVRGLQCSPSAQPLAPSQASPAPVS